MKILCALVLSAFAAGAVHAQMYKWVDEEGRTQYSQKPPPGKKAQELKIQTTAPAAKSEQSTPAANPERSAPGAKSDQSAAEKGKKDKPQPPSGQGADDVHPDLKRLYGEWNTGIGQQVQVRFSVQAGAISFLVSQVWSVGGASAIGTGMKYLITGIDGRGILTPQESRSGPDAQLPTSIGYQFQGDTLLLIVDSGPYAGRHRLTRAAKP